MDTIKPRKNLFEEFNVGAMLPQMGSTEGYDTKLANTPIEDVIDNTNDEINRNNKNDFTVESMMRDFYSEKDENNNDIPDVIEPMVKTLERKGYKVKYSSPGYMNTKFDNDRNNDNIINSKFATTARIIFDSGIDLPSIPDGWEKKTLSNNTVAIYPKKYTYNEESMGRKDKAFLKWQVSYMDNLKDWANNIESKKD